MAKMFMFYFFVAIVVLFGSSGSALHAEESGAVVDYNNELCPVMGRPVNRDISIVYEGKKIYFCCPGCEMKFRANSEKYLSILDAERKTSEEDEW